MDNPFLTNKEELSIIQAIEKAELATSGEIRVHIEKECKFKVPLDRAKTLFFELDMHKTEQKNGVIIYVSTKDHKLAIYGDEGIHKNVEQGFWDDILFQLTYRFKHKKYCQGLCEAIHSIGQKLSALFPYKKNDINEIDNSISYNV